MTRRLGLTDPSVFFSSDNCIPTWMFFKSNNRLYQKKLAYDIIIIYLHDYCNISLRCAILHYKFYLAPAWIVILIDWLSKIQISNFIEYQLFFILIVSCKIWRKYCLYFDRKKFDRILIVYSHDEIIPFRIKYIFLLDVHTFSWTNCFLKEGFNSLYLISNNEWN